MKSHQPSLVASLIPIAALISGLVAVIVTSGADAVQNMSQPILLAGALIALLIAIVFYRRPMKAFRIGLMKSASQILPTVPILLMIGTVSATWMLSGVVPTLIDYGLVALNPKMFLFTTCAVCALISVLSGSSWTTIATIGVAFMGIGTVWGYSPGWIAGAIISGAYFGDKISPLSDTTVLASSTCGVKLFPHIRYMMITTVPAIVIALAVFALVGILTPPTSQEQSSDMMHYLHATFNITPWTLLIPCATILLLVMKLGTTTTLALSTLLGVIGIFLFQPSLLSTIEGTDNPSLLIHAKAIFNILASETSVPTGHELLDSLVSTGGMKGMLSTILLILCAMIFGGVMIGTGMVSTITHSVTKRLKRSQSIVSATVGTGLMLNACTGDQYLSIILNGNLYRNLYHRNRLEPRLLSRSIEDSTSVTSVLIPWNSCGLTQSSVLGVATLHYLPYCIFNIMSPLITIAIAWVGFRIRKPAYKAIA